MTAYARISDDGTIETTDDVVLDGIGLLNEDGSWTLGIPGDQAAARLGYKPFDDQGGDPPALPITKRAELVTADLGDTIRRYWDVRDRPLDEVRSELGATVDAHARQTLALYDDETMAAMEAGQPVPGPVVSARAAIRKWREDTKTAIAAANGAKLAELADTPLLPPEQKAAQGAASSSASPAAR